MSAPIRAAFVALLLAAAPLGGQVDAADRAPGRIDRLVIFGDSLSDPGNAFVATREFEVRPFDPIPDAPYAIKRFHFTNGPTWIEQLARDFDLRRSARPALLRPGVYSNYAFGRARARGTGEFDLNGQINLFLDDFEGVAPPDALYVLWIGANDLRDAFAALAQDSSGMTSQEIIGQALMATGTAIATLHGAGARSFLVLNLPNIANTPAIRALGGMAQDAAEDLSIGYNDGLRTALDQLKALPGITIVRLNVFAILDKVVSNPDLAGLTNVEDSCITPFVTVGAVCRRPDEYLFWDFIHPTEEAHGYLSERAQARLEKRLGISGPARRAGPVM